MAFKKDGGPLRYDIKPDGVNVLVDERGNTITMLREVSWNGRPHRLELRKWNIDAQSETPGKGITFSTEQAPHNLVNVMTGLGYGDTKTIINNIKERPDFEHALVENIGMQKVIQTKNTEYEVEENDYFDPRSMLGVS